MRTSGPAAAVRQTVTDRRPVPNRTPNRLGDRVYLQMQIVLLLPGEAFQRL